MDIERILFSGYYLFRGDMEQVSYVVTGIILFEIVWNAGMYCFLRRKKR